LPTLYSTAQQSEALIFRRVALIIDAGYAALFYLPESKLDPIKPLSLLHAL